MQPDPTIPSSDRQHDPKQTAARSTSEPQRCSLYNLLIVSVGFLSVACWLSLLHWYALTDHYATPGFAFDKVSGHMQSPVIQGTALIFFALGLLYVGTYLLIRAVPRLSLFIKVSIIGTLAVSGVINVLLYPVAAIDLFYYLCQLKLAYFYHQNPYVVTFVPLFAADPLARYAWPLEVPSIYGPAWLLLSGLPALLSGFENLLWLLLSYKIFSFALLGLCGWVIAQYHDDAKDRWLGVYMLLANPLVLFEAVANAHNDIMMTFFLLLAVLALKRQSALALPLLMIAALIKALSVVLVPLFVLAIVTQKWKLRTVIVSLLLTGTLSIVAIVPFWSQGRMLTGLLSGMSFASTFATASIASFLKEYLQQTQAAGTVLLAVRLLLGVGFGLLSILIVWRLRDYERAFAYVLFSFYTLLVALQPWYLIPVVALLSLKHNRFEFAYIALASTVGLLINMLDIWARFSSSLSFTERHLLGTVCMNVPILLGLGVELWRAPRADKHPAWLRHRSAPAS